MKPIQFYTIKSSGGLKVEISNLGAKITKLLIAGRDVVLGFKTAEEWRTQETYFNAICGRVANRIKDGRFSIDGKQYQLPINNGTNSLHGGIEGFNAKLWEVTAQSAYEINKLIIIIRIYIYELHISPEPQYIRGIVAKVPHICTKYTKKQLCSDKVCEYFILHYT